MSGWKFIAATFAVGWLGTVGLLAQATGSPEPVAAPAGQSPLGEPSKSKDQGTGKVLFTRSEDEIVDPRSPQDKSAARSVDKTATSATEGERTSLTFLKYELDVRLSPSQESLAARAQIVVRNDGSQPLKRIALQLSSTLKWEQIQTSGQNTAFVQHPIDSDADHTGAVNEAVITLAQELAPRKELTLLVFYQGQVSLAAERLERIGTPQDIAERSDWDRVSTDFIGLRGFGNVVWYPVNATPVLLGDGARLFTEIGTQKARQQQARIQLTITSEYSAETGAPQLAVLNGQIVPVVGKASPQNSYPGVVTATLPETVLGFATPSVFLLSRKKIEGSSVQVFASSDDLAGAQPYLAAVDAVVTEVQQWLGPKPRRSLAVVSLPEAGDFSAEAGAVAFAGFKATPDAKQLEDAMIHSLAHAYFISRRVWLDEGVPQFLQSLWVEQVQGKKVAIEALGSSRSALALAEPDTPGDAAGQDLIHASDPVFFGTKATYVLWMLRDLAGDAAVKRALQSYNADDDTAPDYFERLVEKASGHDLRWFFDAWVYGDRGLADLSIGGVFPSKSATGDQWLVAVDLANEGFAEAEVPLSVRSQDATVTERVRIPAHSKISHRIPIGSRPTEVQLNDGTVPEIADSFHLRSLISETK